MLSLRWQPQSVALLFWVHSTLFPNKWVRKYLPDRGWAQLDFQLDYSSLSRSFLKEKLFCYTCLCVHVLLPSATLKVWSEVFPQALQCNSACSPWPVERPRFPSLWVKAELELPHRPQVSAALHYSLWSLLCLLWFIIFFSLSSPRKWTTSSWRPGSDSLSFDSSWNLAQGSSLPPTAGRTWNSPGQAQHTSSKLLSTGCQLERKEQDGVLTHISQGDTGPKAHRALSPKCNE